MFRSCDEILNPRRCTCKPELLLPVLHVQSFAASQPGVPRLPRRIPSRRRSVELLPLLPSVGEVKDGEWYQDPPLPLGLANRLAFPLLLLSPLVVDVTNSLVLTLVELL